ncbi:tautomerase [Streptomyces sp. NPDC048504]|uniref:tautomerase n=1 Tax=Streptomyces sp. NPDC048504 TaxID=3365559 RepID=UPI0037123A11
MPTAYVNVIFSEPPSESVFTSGVPGTPLIITGWARRGHPQQDTTRLALELSSTAVRVTGVEEDHVMVVIEDSPARSAVEGGQVLPEPGEEKAWLARRGEV